MGSRGTDGTISDVHVISIVWLVMIGDFPSRGNFQSVPRHQKRNFRLGRHWVADEVAGRQLRQRGHVPRFRGGSAARRRRAAG
jgi:hypothetical protein